MKSVLITGGTGTLGRALARQLLSRSLSDRVCIYSRGEHAQADMREAFGDDERLRWFVGDVRDLARLRRAMWGCEVIVHAAALKRIEVGQYNPTEMVKTNVVGTLNVVEAAQDADVAKVLMISSDKAYQPISPYGQSKALAESIVLAANNTVAAYGPKFAVCRYGNVWCSNGSVVPKWRALAESGANSVPVTDPECTRFFMQVEQAVDLVLDTIASMQGGETAIPVLPAYRLGDLVEALGMFPTVTGLPPWEKKHESMSDLACSIDARRMSVAELRLELERVGYRPLLVPQHYA